MWARFVGIPYKPHRSEWDGADCYGLIRLVYREMLGIELTAWEQTLNPGAKRPEIVQAFENALTEGLWQGVDKPERGDIVVLHLYRYPLHCGVMVDNLRFLHTTENTGSVVERLDSSVWAKRIANILRYRDGR